jgi:hypothetical protein
VKYKYLNYFHITEFLKIVLKFSLEIVLFCFFSQVSLAEGKGGKDECGERAAADQPKGARKGLRCKGLLVREGGG